jgi:creatinine amidohydrolase
MNSNPPPVRWAELLPHEFLARQAARSVVYLPMGLCEPHGPITAFGLDTIKADYLCDEAARRFGGVVAPTQGYQIHEVGNHAPWLAEVLGNQRTYLTSLPTHVMLYTFLYQLRAFYNADFQAICVVSGHSGGNQRDFRLAAQLFTEATGMPIFVASDPELVEGLYEGDHAGFYEISQQLYLRPDLVDLRRDFRQQPGTLGRFAQGLDCQEATADVGRDILEKSLTRLGEVVDTLLAGPAQERTYLTHEPIETLYQQLLTRRVEWFTEQPVPTPPPPDSMWRAYCR